MVPRKRRVRSPASKGLMLARNRSDVGVRAMAHMSIGKQLQAICALGPLLVGTLVVDWASLGTLMGAYSLAVIVMALPVGIRLARFCVRAVLLAGVGRMGSGRHPALHDARSQRGTSRPDRLRRGWGADRHHRH